MAPSYNALARSAFHRAASLSRGAGGTVEGVGRIQTAFRLLDAEVQKQVKATVAESTRAVEADAMRGAPVSDEADRKAKQRAPSGELRDSIRGVISADGFTGRVMAGYGKLQRRSRALTLRGQARYERQSAARQERRERNATRFREATSSVRAMQLLELGNYAPVVEYGDPKRGKPARPFMRRALNAHKGPHHARLRAALDKSTRVAAQA